MKWRLLIPVVVLLTGCKASGPVTDSYCLIAKPIYISKQDTLTDQTAWDIYTHNSTWRDLCQKGGAWPKTTAQ